MLKISYDERNMLKRYIVSFVFVCIGFCVVLTQAKGVFAGTLLFDPASQTITVGQNVSLKVNVDAGTDNITSVDAYITYDSNVLELPSGVASIADGTFFPSVSKFNTQPGKIYIAGMVNDPATSKTGTGTIATITFRGKANGTATVKYDCTQGLTTDSNISKNEINATDLIVCASNGSSVITVGTGVSAATPTPTTAGGGTTNPTPTALPRSGIFDNMSIAVPAAFLIMVGGLVRLLL